MCGGRPLDAFALFVVVKEGGEHCAPLAHAIDNAGLLWRAQATSAKSDMAARASSSLFSATAAFCSARRPSAPFQNKALNRSSSL